MKKFSLLLITALVAFSMSAQEVQNVSHGTVYLKNKASDNWFIGLGGGVNTYNMKKFDNIGDRLGWQGQLSVGRWNSPMWGARLVIDAGEPVINYANDTKMNWIGGHLEFDKEDIPTDVERIEHGVITVVALTWKQQNDEDMEIVKKIVDKV